MGQGHRPGRPRTRRATGSGEFAYAVLADPKDFSLIRLDPGVEASPEMCNYGGPTGINDDISDGPKVLEYFGNGIGIGSTVPARSAVALGFPNADHVYAAGLALPGDSGSGVITDDGRAVGVLVTTGLHGLGSRRERGRLRDHGDHPDRPPDRPGRPRRWASSSHGDRREVARRAAGSAPG